MPLRAPGSETPWTNKTTRTRYGNKAVKYTTCTHIQTHYCTALLFFHLNVKPLYLLKWGISESSQIYVYYHSTKAFLWQSSTGRKTLHAHISAGRANNQLSHGQRSGLWSILLCSQQTFVIVPLMCVYVRDNVQSANHYCKNKP